MLSIRKKIFISLTVALMTIIFLFSAENATLSEENSNWAANLIGRLFCDDYEDFEGSLEKTLSPSLRLDAAFSLWV